MLYLTSSYDFENNFKFCCQDAVDLWWIDMVLLSLTQISNTFSKTQFSLLDIFCDDEKVELFLLLNRFKGDPPPKNLFSKLANLRNLCLFQKLGT